MTPFINRICPVLESVEVDATHVYHAANPTAPRPLVAICDTGVDWTHPALAPHVWINPGEGPANRKDDDKNGHVDDRRGWNFAENSARPLDSNGHGTHCAGIAVQQGAAVMAVQVLDDGNWGQEPWIAAGIRYAVTMGARVISLSLGNGQRFAKIEAAVKWAQDRGALIVAAAGNDASDIRREPIYPACLPGVLSVMAMDYTGAAPRLWSASNYGGQVAAPGKSIYSTLPKGLWGKYSGTSMATPFVAALAARIFALRPEWTGPQVANRIVATCDRAGNQPAVNVRRALELPAVVSSRVQG